MWELKSQLKRAKFNNNLHTNICDSNDILCCKGNRHMRIKDVITASSHLHHEINRKFLTTITHQNTRHIMYKQYLCDDVNQISRDDYVRNWYKDLKRSVKNLDKNFGYEKFRSTLIMLQ